MSSRRALHFAVVAILVGVAVWAALRQSRPLALTPPSLPRDVAVPAPSAEVASTGAAASGALVVAAPSGAAGASDVAGGAAPPTSTASPPARVTETQPSGVRVALDRPLIVRFDRAPDPAGVTLLLEPPAEGKVTWPAPDTLTFTPARWAEGKPYHARIAGPALAAPATFEFRSLVPAPERIEPGRGQRLVLTFDDGADRASQVTALLDLLQKEQIQAIFFPIGKWAESNARLIERMRGDGHRVCNHTYSHQNLRLPQLSDDEIRSEIARGAGAGTCPLLRPPLKAFDPRSERLIAEMGYTIYLWDIDSRDWEGAPAEDIINLVLAKAHPGAVVLFHMHAEATLAALPVLLPKLRKAGYVFRDPEDGGAPLPDAAP